LGRYLREIIYAGSLASKRLSRSHAGMFRAFRFMRDSRTILAFRRRMLEGENQGEL
jgi:hypothetical protein